MAGQTFESFNSEVPIEAGGGFVPIDGGSFIPPSDNGHIVDGDLWLNTDTNYLSEIEFTIAPNKNMFLVSDNTALPTSDGGGISNQQLMYQTVPLGVEAMVTNSAVTPLKFKKWYWLVIAVIIAVIVYSTTNNKKR